MPLSASSPRCVMAMNCARPLQPNVQSKLSSAAFDATAYLMSAVPPNHSSASSRFMCTWMNSIRAAAADALEGDAVQLVVGAELDAGELDAHVAQRAAVVVGLVAAVDAGVGLADALAALDVDRRAAVDDEAAPVAAGAAADRLIAREHDRRGARADRVQPAAAHDDQRADAARLADDARAGRRCSAWRRPRRRPRRAARSRSCWSSSRCR